MPAAPRQGRKGGKIATPATAAAASGRSGHDTPVGVTSPGTVIHTTETLLADPKAMLEFDLRALIDKRGSSTGATATAAAAATAASGSLPVPPTTVDNLLKFDLAAIAQVGQGVVVGRSRTVHAESSKPTTSFDEVSWTVKGILCNKSLSPDAAGFVELSELEAVSKRDVTVVRRSHTALALCVALATRVLTSKSLVVVSHRALIAPIAETLRMLLNRQSGSCDGMGAATAAEVGELFDQTYKGSEACNLWVSDAETALMYLYSQKGLAPFTHVVTPGLNPMTPLEAYLVWGLRERVFRRSPNLESSAPALHLIMHSMARQEAVVVYFKGLDAAMAAVDDAEERIEFSYDEAHAFSKMDMLDIVVDTTGKFPRPHPRLADHLLKVATKIVTRIIMEARSSKTIYVLATASPEMCSALQLAHLKDTEIYLGRSLHSTTAAPTPSATAVSPNGNASTEEPVRHRVFVMHTLMGLFDGSDELVDFVLDMGMAHRLIVQSKSENFLESHVSEWATKDEIQERKDMVGIMCAGGYFTLYPPAAEALFPEKRATADNYLVIEDALLQCLRAELPIHLATQSILVPIEADMMEQALHNLAEKCFVANTSGSGITFAGEIAGRLPLDIDLTHFVINGCAIGLCEATVAMAAVASNWFNTGSSGQAIKAQILSNRATYAGEAIASQSDLLADTIVFLEWLRLKTQGESTKAMVEPLGEVMETRLEVTTELVTVLRDQLSDYAFIDDLRSIDVMDATIQCIKNNVALLIFMQSVAMARRTVFVRESGNLNVQNRSAAFAFVRTSKRVTDTPTFPSSVPWNVGAMIVPMRMRTTGNIVLGANLSLLNSAYFFSSLLLLHPHVEYSAPTEVSGKGRVVHFGVTCNRQMKRFSVSIEDAASILDFRERWNHSLGYLKALRTTRRPLSRRRFEMVLKEKNHLFSLEDFHKNLQREFLLLATELEVTERQGSFDTNKMHFLTPDDMIKPVAGVTSSDLLVVKRFHDGDLWSLAAVGQNASETPASMQSPAVIAAAFPAKNSAPVAAAFFEDDEDEVEVIADSFFVKHGPIIDDDSDDDA